MDAVSHQIEPVKFNRFNFSLVSYAGRVYSASERRCNTSLPGSPMATISDVARRAGVTRATVSNVLRRPEIVKPTTVARVRAAIEEVGYRPNLLARALAEGRSSMIAVI